MSTTRGRNQTLLDSQHTSQQTYTGISDIILHGKTQLALKKQNALTHLLSRKQANEQARLKSVGVNRWKGFMRDLEMYSVKLTLKRLSNEVEGLKF